MVEEEPQPVGRSAKRDFKLVLLAGVAVIIGVIVLAFLNYQSALGLQGVTTIQSGLNLVDSVPNGIPQLVTDFFNWLGHFFSSTPLWIVGGI